MWISGVWLAFWVFVLSTILHSSSALFQYSATEFKVHLHPPASAPLHHPDILYVPQRRSTHRGSRRHYQYGNSGSIKSFWSTTPRPSKNTGRRANHSVLAHVPRAASTANAAVSLSSTTVTVGLLNICALNTKAHLVQDLMTDRKLDMLCLTETWQKPNDYAPLNDATPPGNVYRSEPRATGRRGGGVAMIFRKDWKVAPVVLPAYKSFEATIMQLHGPIPTVFATVYRPPPAPNQDFFTDITAFFTFLSTLSPNVIILGDFNIHMDILTNSHTRQFNSCLDTFGYQQLVNFPTHKKGHSLDLIICAGVTPNNCTADLFPPSDHHFLSFTVNLSFSKSISTHTIHFRNIKDINTRMPRIFWASFG